MTPITTTTDASLGPWPVDNSDEIVRLREWGTTDRIHPLASQSWRDLVIGTAADCDVRLVDPSHRISRLHAYLRRDGERWVIRDRSKNGLSIDGAPCSEQVLLPGAELEIGRIKLVAESNRLIALRGYLARLLGWAAPQTEAVDLALRAVRMAGMRRTALVLCGSDDLVAIAAGIHYRALGADRPFIVCDPRRQRGEANTRSAENYDQGIPAVAAAGGSLCVRPNRLPRDFPQVMTALQNQATRVQLIVCAEKPAECKLFPVTPIIVPSLSTRANEVAHVIFEYAQDAIASLASTKPFTPEDREWVRTHTASTLPEIEKATRRLVALRMESGNLPRAAERLGITRVALSKWIGRRRLPTMTSEQDTNQL